MELTFQSPGLCAVHVCSDGGQITSNGGLPLPAAVTQRLTLTLTHGPAAAQIGQREGPGEQDQLVPLAGPASQTNSATVLPQ